MGQEREAAKDGFEKRLQIPRDSFLAYGLEQHFLLDTQNVHFNLIFPFIYQVGGFPPDWNRFDLVLLIVEGDQNIESFPIYRGFVGGRDNFENTFEASG